MLGRGLADFTVLSSLGAGNIVNDFSFSRHLGGV
jgi:hypothetical protein